jgi:5'-deoxynucleotidase YfbR-like HD superfamily hydrolase
MSAQAFFEGLASALQLMRRVKRWDAPMYRTYNAQPDEHKETTLEHSMISVIIAHYVLCLERDHGATYNHLDTERILLGALLHDLGEGAAGDILFKFKQDPVVKERLKVHEDAWANETLGLAPACMKEDLDRAYALEGEENLEGRFFAAIECLSYIIFARMQYETEEREEFASVFERQHPRIVAFAEEFGGVRVAYEEHREFLERVAPLP